MNALDRVREKYKSPNQGTSKTCKSPSASFAGPHDRHIESNSLVIAGLDREQNQRDADRRQQACGARLAAVTSKLRENPAVARSWEIHQDVSEHFVVAAIAIRGIGACELSIPKEKWDPFRFLELLEIAECS